MSEHLRPDFNSLRSEFLDLAAERNLRPEVQEFPLEAANEALIELKMRKIRGAKVLRIA
jgi:alcohol dehydrogenase, propanol-preferring